MPFQERDAQSAFTKYLRLKNPIPFSFVYELKITKTKRFPWSRVAPHQWVFLEKANAACLHHKISDLSLGQKPFDGFNICRAAAYVGICFYSPRKNKVLYLIDIEPAKQHAKKNKSIAEEEASAMASHIFLL